MTVAAILGATGFAGKASGTQKRNVASLLTVLASHLGSANANPKSKSFFSKIPVSASLAYARFNKTLAKPVAPSR